MTLGLPMRKMILMGVIALMPQFVFVLIYLVGRLARGQARDTSDVLVLAIEMILGSAIVICVRWLWKTQPSPRD